MADVYGLGHKHTAEQLGITADSLGVTASSLGLGNLVGIGIQTGSVTITPAADTVSSQKVYFPKAFKSAPAIVIVSPQTSVPYTYVRYATASDYTKDGFTLYIYRTNSTSTVVKWIAVGSL